MRQVVVQIAAIAPVPYCFWELWEYRSGRMPLFYGQLGLFSVVVVSLFGSNREEEAEE